MYDLHVHTRYSDGRKTPEEVIEEAADLRLPVLAITDHNEILEELPELRKKNEGRIHLVNGCELSTVFRLKDGSSEEIHIIALDFDSEKLRPVIERNRFDHSSYYGEMRRKLAALGILVPTYEEMKKKHPAYVGRSNIADYMVQEGYAFSVDEVMDLYLGARGERKAFVDQLQYASFVSMEEGVRAVVEAGGVPVLAHLFLYRMPDEERRRLAAAFRKAAGDHPAGLEVFYSKYNESQWEALRRIADEYDLYYSIASDYHGRPGQQMMRRLFLEDRYEERMIHRVLDIPDDCAEKIRWSMEYIRIYRCAMKLISGSLSRSKMFRLVPPDVREIMEDYMEPEYRLPDDFWTEKYEDEEDSSFDDMVWEAFNEFAEAYRWYEILLYLIDRKHGKTLNQ